MVAPKLQQASGSSEGLDLSRRVSDSLGQGQNPKLWVSKKSSGDADAAGPEATD